MTIVATRYIERTSLDEAAFVKTIKKYAKLLKLSHDISIVFDMRLACYGIHCWDSSKKIHLIRISPTRCKFQLEGESPVRLGPAAEKYKILSTLLHELRHAQQKEELGHNKFYSKNYGSVKEIKNPEASTYFSECERDARIFEDTYIDEAVEYYDSSCK
jgi:hypothetical protein